MAEAKDPVVLKFKPLHPGEGFIGVPQRDLTQADVDALVGEARRNVLHPAGYAIYQPVEVEKSTDDSSSKKTDEKKGGS